MKDYIGLTEFAQHIVEYSKNVLNDWLDYTAHSILNQEFPFNTRHSQLTTSANRYIRRKLTKRISVFH